MRCGFSFPHSTLPPPGARGLFWDLDAALPRKAGGAGRGIGASAEEVGDRGYSVRLSLQGSWVVAADYLKLEPSWAVDTACGRPAPKSILARGDAAAVVPACLCVALPVLRANPDSTAGAGY